MNDFENGQMLNYQRAIFDRLDQLDDFSMSEDQFKLVIFERLQMMLDQNITSFEDLAGLFGHRVIGLDSLDEEEYVISLNDFDGEYLIAA